MAWRGSSSIWEAAAAAAMQNSREGVLLDLSRRRRPGRPPGTFGSPIPVSYAVDMVEWVD